MTRQQHGKFMLFNTHSYKKLRKKSLLPFAWAAEEIAIMEQFTVSEQAYVFKLYQKACDINQRRQNSWDAQTEKELLLATMIHIAAKYPLKDIERVLHTLARYNEVQPDFLSQFLDVMNSFEGSTDCQFFIEIFRQSTAIFQSPRDWRTSLASLREKVKHQYFFLDQGRLTTVLNEQRLTALLRLKDEGRNLQVLRDILERIAHTEYPKFNIEKLCSQSYESLCNILSIIGLLKKALITDKEGADYREKPTKPFTSPSTARKTATIKSGYFESGRIESTIQAIIGT